MAQIIYLTNQRELIEQVAQFVHDWHSDSKTISTFTSGSTGKPKEIVLEKEHMKASALASGKFFDFKKDQRMRLALSPKTIGGKMLLLRGILHEMIIEIVEPSKNPLAEIQHTIDFISLVPYQLEHMILQGQKFDQVKTILLGGAPVSENLAQTIKEIPSEVYSSYGMTETMSHVALKNVKKELAFKAIEGVTFRTTENGQLIIQAPAIGVENLQTNDVIELLNETTFIWKGRADFVINSAGIKIHPEEVEKKLSSEITSRFFIFGEKDETFGERVCILIESTDENISIDFDHYLSKYEKPKKVYFIPQFIETTSGKINRLATIQLL